MTNNRASLSDCFAACSCTPITTNISETSRIVANDDGYFTKSYLMDSSGRSKFVLPLQLVFPTKEDAEFLAESGCLPGIGDDLDDEDSGALRFEITSITSAGVDKVVTVEDIRVVSCKPKGSTILVETELVVRASKANDGFMSSRAAFTRSIINEMEDEIDVVKKTKDEDAQCQLEVTAVLITPKINTVAPPPATSMNIPSGLMAMQLGGGVIPLSEQSANLKTRLTSFHLNLTLTQALRVSVKTIAGSNAGSTLVSLTMTHSNTHDEEVKITNIALHPGHSRTEFDQVTENDHQSMPGGQNVVTDMSQCVKWGFGPRTEPKLPLILRPHEAYSTVLTIEAGEDLRSRAFFSPISVTAVVLDMSVVETTATQWTTGRIAVEPADAFRIDLSLQQSSACHVGAPLVVSLKVLNLSTETRDLMLLMAKDEEKAGSIAPSTSKHAGSVNTAVVSEVNGYTFGVWGLSGDDDGTTRHNRDSELLAVDAALLLGEVKGQHSVDAELRFVPLREGTLDVPNLKLYDKTEGKWYNCMHMLKIVVAAKPE